MRSPGDVAAWCAVALAVALALGLTAHRIAFSPAGIVILPDPQAPWIQADAPVTALLQQWGREEAPVTRFFTSFSLERPAARAELSVRAFGPAQVTLNGEPVSFAASPPGTSDWKRFRRTEVGLRAGSNTLHVDVANRRGPALLALRLAGDGFARTTGPDWLALADDGTTRRTRPASDRRRHPDSYASERPLAALVEMGSAVALLGGLAATAFLVARRRAVGAPSWLPAAAGGGVVLAWVVLLAVKLRHLGLDVGFDAGNHLDYVEGLRRDGRLPRATEHWSAYHPPLFYLASAGLDALAGALGAVRSHSLALKGVPFLAGLGNVALAGALARRLVPEDRVARALAIVFAGFLPVNLYVAAYFSNEGLHAFLAGLALVLAVGLLRADRVSLRGAALVSLALGAALLTKFTAVLVAGPVLLALGAKILVVERGRPGAAGGRLAALLLPLLGVAGWFYVRNVLEYGRPLVGNWDLPDPRRSWWSPPGFHTPGYYLHFGEALLRPYFAGFVSFWDALYSTFWGDGFVGGRAGVRWRHPLWNYTFMAAGYLLALPATLLLGAGFVGILGAAWRDRDARRRAAFGLLGLVCAAMGFAVFWATLALPYHGQARASYLLALVPVWALCFARATSGLERRLAARGWTAARALLVAWLGALFGVLYLGFAG